jgi:dipeptidyl aminopeptidase/acylaminoacyl peptidase
MRRLALVLTLACINAYALPGTPPAVQREEVGQRLSENIPPMPAAMLERLGRYQNTRGASFGGWLADGGMIVVTRFGETNQAHQVRVPLGMREQLSFYREPISSVFASPRGDGFVFGKDEGGSEFWQLYWYDLATREPTLLSDGKRSRNEAPVWSHDGAQLAWSSTARNGTDTDIWVRDMNTGAARAVVTEGGAWFASDFSPDGERLLVQRRVSINEIHPGVVDLASGKLEMFPVDGGTAGFGPFLFGPDGKQVYYVSDEETEFLTLRHHDPAGGAPRALSADIPWNVQWLDIAPDGKHLAFVSNEDGIGKLHVRSLPSHQSVTLPALPIGVIANLAFSPDGGRIALTINSATSPSDVFVLDLAQHHLARWTRSEVGGLDESGFIAPRLVRYPTFDLQDGKPRTIPAFYYQPQGDGPFPVVINIHGGPEVASASRSSTPRSSSCCAR